MDGIRFIPGIQWAADILEGRRPIPTNKSKLEKGEGFQEILDEETKKIKEEQTVDLGRSNAQVRSSEDVR